MTASRLREAADLLLARAEAATPGPWVNTQNWLELGVPDNSASLVGRDGQMVGWDTGLHYGDGNRNSDYIAMMSPPVALALADWLDEVAARDGAHYWRGIKPALAIADAILGTPAKDAAAEGEGSDE